VFESKFLPALEEAKFSLLESIRTILNPSGVAATISIGIGKEGTDFEESYNFAVLAVEMALSRGGDQAVIKDRYNFTFFGGRAREAQRHTKVKSRVVASTLAELIRQSEQVFVMGHKNADLDAVGAAAGIQCLCRTLGKQAKIVLDPRKNVAQELISLLRDVEGYEDAFITPDDAMILADPKSLLVVVDTNRPDQVESQSLLEAMPKVAIIDHHRKTSNSIEQTVLSLHEPSASSASELVTELLQYAVEPKDVLPEEAKSLLAGIVLDTKRFTMRTGGRTFEAAVLKATLFCSSFTLNSDGILEAISNTRLSVRGIRISRSKAAPILSTLK
jgi:c-di-AMP phosphodiesterase-like protein